ncbi:MAG: hypothetical protein BI182_04095 [Acetobacterium sp. MES1]|uniref:hypothetical protein n=1 Tax=Acetobacterium sp. MES1 TaxID=1899015 RepID=UPI000B9CD431|nr:hypothetical protein [Acetobacterium sp. MES1]OXS27207.1 MAG: hypothetical protein BI182_04095 [Acetobacterium sp. MES1]
MTFDYACCKNLSGKASWKGQVRLITTVDPYELTVTARNSSFHIICGTYTHGNFLCIPDLGVSTPLAALNDTFWNLEQLTINNPDLSEPDAISIICALKALKSHLAI